MIKKWNLRLLHQPRLDDDVVERHERFITSLSGLQAPWAIPLDEKSRIDPVAPGELAQVFQLKKVMPKGIKGRIVYTARVKTLDDMDDIMNVDFDSRKVDFNYVATDVFETYIKAFNAYRAELSTDEITDLMRQDLDKMAELRSISYEKVHSRRFIYRIPLVAYYSHDLCKKALKMTPRKIVKRLNKHVERVYEFHEGVIIAHSYSPIGEEEYYNIDGKIRRLLANPLKRLFIH